VFPTPEPDPLETRSATTSVCRPKCIIVIGPESSGSKLAAKICAHAVGVHAFGTWNAVGWTDGCESGHRVCHRSLPFGTAASFPDLESMIAEHRDRYDIRLVLTTRDRTLSELSRRTRFGKSAQQVSHETDRATTIIKTILGSEWPSFLFSYETFMLLGKDYLDLLYRFLGTESDFMPELRDGNAERLRRGLA
jgi:hypothetical protein